MKLQHAMAVAKAVVLTITNNRDFCKGESKMQVIIGCDHAALDLKNEMVSYLKEQGYDVVDKGTYTSDRIDYPVVAEKVSEQVLAEKDNLGVLICGTGIGMSMAANKIKGIRAAAVSEPYSARLTRQHNDANIICFGARVIGSGLAKLILDEFLTTKYEGERHANRVDMICALESGKTLISK